MRHGVPRPSRNKAARRRSSRAVATPRVPAAYKVCKQDFTFKIGGAERAHFGEMPAAADGAKSDVWFSLMKARVVHDGAWVSTDPVDASKGVPLTLHGAGPKDTFGGVFELEFARHAIPSLAVADAIGDYDKSALVSSTLDIWRAWAANVEISIGFDKLSIKKAA